MSVEQERTPASQRAVEITLIAVNYNSEQATAQLLADAMGQSTQNCKLSVVIADNGPTVTELDGLREKYHHHPAVRFVRMPRNLGYFGAAHHALQTVFGHDLPDWIIVSNAVVRLIQKDLFDRLARKAVGPGAIAPGIISGRTGLDQNPFHRVRPSALRMLLNRIIPRFSFLYWLLNMQFAIRRGVQRIVSTQNPEPLPHSTRIYAPHGAFIIFANKYFECGGDLNVGAFLFAEEKFVAETCRRLGLDVFYDPSLEVFHDEHIATAHSPDSRRFQISASDYIYREFFTRSRQQVRHRC